MRPSMRTEPRAVPLRTVLDLGGSLGGGLEQHLALVALILFGELHVDLLPAGAGDTHPQPGRV